MPSYDAPGIYRREIERRSPTGLRTGVPAFVGVARPVGDAEPDPWYEVDSAEMLSALLQPKDGGYLAAAVFGFFENGGRTCFVAPVRDASYAELVAALTALEAEEGLDLVCAPDIMLHYRSQLEVRSPDRPEIDRAEVTRQVREEVRAMQLAVLEHCERVGTRFAILDSWWDGAVADARKQRRDLNGRNGALYFPWISILGGRPVPPCGHIAGVYARSDEAGGVQRTPANETLRGALDLTHRVDGSIEKLLSPESINCLRPQPGRGIQVWGGRTLSLDRAWTYISVRRIFMTSARWIDHNMRGFAFEPNGLKLWARIERELGGFFEYLFRRGALRGEAPHEAYYVKCDLETNSIASRDRGESITEIGLAPGIPGEFVVVQLVHDASGTRIAGPTTPG